jgi:PAS domain S-box-containing protein
MSSHELLAALPVAVYTTDADGRITFYNDAAADLWGHRPELGSDRWCGSWRLFWPDGRPLPHDECPMAVTLKEGRPVRGVEAIAERPDGTRVRFLPFPTPLRDASGKLTGAINLLLDISDREQAEMESARLAAIVASSDDAIVSKTLDGRISTWNAGATRIFGYDADEMIGQPITRIIPPELHDEEKRILALLRRGEHVDHYETVRVAKDGRRIDISLTVSPLRDKFGRIVGASKVGRDVTERKQSEKLQRLLVEELNHRVKNTLATVQAVASQSFRRANSIGDFVSSFGGRVQALARAHDVLTRTTLQSAKVGELVREQVVFGGVDESRVSCTGPELALDARTSVHVAMVLHELATNARKYGALSVPQGRLSVAWEMQTNGGRRLLLEWKENGGPPVSAPKEHGFGTILIERTMQAHGGEASMRYASDGVTCRISLPLPDQAPTDVETYAARPKTEAGLWLLQQPPGKERLDGKRILVVEDEPLVAMDLESSLTAAGCEIVGPAGTLDKARPLIAEAHCDAALIDVNLAGQPIDELAAALTRQNIPFAFVTGYGPEALPRAFQEAVVLRKPFSEDQLLAVVELLLYQADTAVPLRAKKP